MGVAPLNEKRRRALTAPRSVPPPADHRVPKDTFHTVENQRSARWRPFTPARDWAKEEPALGQALWVDGERLRVSSSCAIPLSELRWRFSRSGGPGGQHANTSDTRVEVVFDVAASPSLGPRQRARLLERLGPEVRAVAGDERSQARNRAVALERLAARLRAGLRIDRTRRPTRPSAAAARRRLQAKRRRAEIKRLRRPPDEGEHG
jgi:ribosome-associated protein